MSDVDDDGIVDLTTGDDDVVDDGIPIDLTADDTGDNDMCSLRYGMLSSSLWEPLAWC